MCTKSREHVSTVIHADTRPTRDCDDLMSVGCLLNTWKESKAKRHFPLVLRRATRPTASRQARVPVQRARTDLCLVTGLIQIATKAQGCETSGDPLRPCSAHTHGSIDPVLAKNYTGGWKQKMGSVPWRKLHYQYREREREREQAQACPLHGPWECAREKCHEICRPAFAVALSDRLCGLVVRVPGYTTEMYCASCEVRIEFIYVMKKKVDRLCGLVVRVPGYRLEMYCASCEVQTQFIYTSIM
jgi:hypothetical protein